MPGKTIKPRKVTAKLKSCPVKITLEINPAWSKQMKVVKAEISKLSKLEVYHIKTK